MFVMRNLISTQPHMLQYEMKFSVTSLFLNRKTETFLSLRNQGANRMLFEIPKEQGTCPKNEGSMKWGNLGAGSTKNSKGSC